MDIDAKEAEIFESQSNASVRSFIYQAISENEGGVLSSYWRLHSIYNQNSTGSNTQ